MDRKQLRLHSKWLAGFIGLGVAIFLLGAAAWLPSSPAHASPRQRNAASVAGDTVALVLTNSGDTFTYGVNNGYGPPPMYGPSPIFQITVTLAQPYAANYGAQAAVQIDGGAESFPSTGGGGPQSFVFTLRLGSTDIPPGTHSAVAVYTNVETHVTTTSNSVSFTIQKAPMNVSCVLRSQGSSMVQWMAGTMAQVALGTSNTVPNTPVDWSQGTATITFIGPTTVTYANVRPDSSGRVTVTTPAQVGYYAISCSFTSTDYYIAVLSYTSLKNLDISQAHPLAGIQLFTNPTTITAGKATLVYVVFQGIAGLPAPTGKFNISISDPNTAAGFYSQPLQIGAHGALEFKIGALPGGSGAQPGIGSWDRIQISYPGDPYYAGKKATFTMTNPAIPGGTTGGGGATPGAGTPASSTPTAGAGANASTEPGAPPTRSGAPGARRAAGSPFNGWVIALLLVAIVIVGGAGGAAFMLVRRRAAGQAGVSAAPGDPRQFPPYQSPPYW